MKGVLVVFTLIICHQLATAQKNVKLSGKVVIAESGEAVIGAVVYSSNANQYTTTNQYGQFVLTLPTGIQEIRCHYPSYKNYIDTLHLRQDSTVTIRVEPSTLEEVIIKNANPPSDYLGLVRIPVTTLKQIPMLLGEPDLFKSLAFIPGIMTGQEGSTGLYVRGSSPDQNLVLLDEAIVYNTSHAFGFVSVFNPDAVKNMDVYKGAFSARYGGRIASIIDLTMKEGNNQRSRKEFAIGMLNSRLLIEGPIKKNRSSYLIAARTMHTSLLQLRQLGKVILRKNYGNSFNFWFYDLNLKLNHTFKDNSQLLFSVYSNHDNLQSGSRSSEKKTQNSLDWGSITSSLRYNRSLLPQLFWRVVGTFSHFNTQFLSTTVNTIEKESSKDESQLKNSIRDWTIKSVFDFTPSNTHKISAGFEQTFHRYFPGQLKVIRNNTTLATNLNGSLPIYTRELAMYLEDEINLKPFRAQLGIRRSQLSVENHTYANWEPRASLTWRLSKHHSLQGGYSRMQQYMHQVTSNGVGLPNEIWVPATAKVRPIRSDQFELGWKVDQASFHFSLEGYYKDIQDLLEYQYGSDVVTDYQKNWQDLVITGVKGRAYGIETMLQKKVGRLNGWLSYTYAVSQRQTPEINNGEWFYARYDRRHNATIVANYQLTFKWNLVANWIYQTGHPIDLPLASYITIQGVPRPYYTGRNQTRMPHIHRLDVGASYKNITKKGREYRWNVGLYNAYNRTNPFYLEVNPVFVQGVGIEKYEVFQRGFFPILPYFSYQIFYF